MRKQGVVCGLLLAFFALALLARLGHYTFWQDEAETALLAKSILQNGLPITKFDGKWITQFNGLEANQNHLWVFTPWLPLYITAASFKIFGFSEWAGRIPFALAGFFAALLFLKLVRQWTANSAAATLALFFYVTNVSLILYSRQCKYYPLLLFGYLLALYGLQKNFWVVAAGFLIAFHCNYLSAGLAFAGFGLYSFLFEEGKKCRPVFWKTALTLLLLFAPFFLLSPFGERLNVSGQWASLGLYFKKLGNHLYYWNQQFFPILLGLLLFWRRPPHFKLIAVTLLVSWLGLPLLGQDSLRYTLYLAPLFCFLPAFFVVEVFQKQKALGVLLFLTLTATNFFQNMPDAAAEKSFGKLFEKEEWTAIKNYYFGNVTDPLREIPAKMKSAAAPEDRVLLNHDSLAWEWYSDIPVAFKKEEMTWWIGPHWVKLQKGAYVAQEAIQGILTIETEIPVANWGLNSPIRYKHFLKRFGNPLSTDTAETIRLVRTAGPLLLIKEADKNQRDRHDHNP